METNHQERFTPMRCSHNNFHSLILTLAVAILSIGATTAMAADPGSAFPATSEASDNKAGSLLVYNYYNSDSSNATTRNTTLSITNTNQTRSIIVHFFFVSSICSVADYKTKLTQNQTYSLEVSDVDPDISGYVMAVAENSDGLPIAHNSLIGDMYIRDEAKSVNLSAVSFSADWGAVGTVLPGALTTTSTVTVNFSGAFGGYNRLPAAVALSNLPSRATGDRTLLILNSVGGDYMTSAGDGTKSIFGLLYDDAEQSSSFSISITCQYAKIIDDNNPRTVPRFSTFIPAGRTGWMRLYGQDGSKGLMGAMIVWNIVKEGTKQGAHNLHHLTLTSTPTSATLPVYPY
jgi:hypothetical protein